MLGIMRKYKQSIIIKIVFSVIVLSFVGTIFLIWGKGEDGLKGSSYAVKVNGESISYDEYLKNYERAKDSLQQIYGQPVTPEIEKLLNLRKSTIDNLINSALIRQEAKNMGIKVSDDELVDAIAKIPYFQKDGVFDKKLYDQVLRMNHITTTNFENGVRDDHRHLQGRQNNRRQGNPYRPGSPSVFQENKRQDRTAVCFLFTSRGAEQRHGNRPGTDLIPPTA